MTPAYFTRLSERVQEQAEASITDLVLIAIEDDDSVTNADVVSSEQGNIKRLLADSVLAEVAATISTGPNGSVR
ncbi:MULTISPECIES: hypothetical protein [Cyanophyceae]|uniref:Uncharacterized protein n=1 Tax=Leptolyngbya subtilissima DQ-A4 TaxID=2933933 RepID=A0ABV0K6B8_9CYAN|nr:hypothetical protein [Nodosilinea sp. FACHB-141]MBD2113870.1 hypothetical protein [Nodosilinea sp. FACHB-141]